MDGNRTQNIIVTVDAVHKPAPVMLLRQDHLRMVINMPYVWYVIVW